jgi:hypothetical protein
MFDLKAFNFKDLQNSTKSNRNVLNQPEMEEGRMSDCCHVTDNAVQEHP